MEVRERSLGEEQGEAWQDGEGEADRETELYPSR